MLHVCEYQVLRKRVSVNAVLCFVRRIRVHSKGAIPDSGIHMQTKIRCDG